MLESVSTPVSALLQMKFLCFGDEIKDFTVFPAIYWYRCSSDTRAESLLSPLYKVRFIWYSTVTVYVYHYFHYLQLFDLLVG